MDGNFYEIASVLLGYINAWPERPAEAKLYSYGAGLPALRLSLASGVRQLRLYADGTKIMCLTFAVSLRTSDGEPLELLQKLADYIQNAGLSPLGERLFPLAIEQIEPPQRTGADVSGLVEYTMPLRLIYAVQPRYD